MLGKIFEGDALVRGMQVVVRVPMGIALVFSVFGNAGTAYAESSTIVVNNVERLYEVVNDSANAGAAVFLSPGVYTLSAIDPGGTPRPNGGRLDLQADMSLYGLVGVRGAVIIDAGRKDASGNRLLPASSFGFPFGRTGVIRVGCGSNRIEWLTIDGNPLAAASIETDLVSTNPACKLLPTAVRVAHVVAHTSARGVDIRNVSAEMADRLLVAEIEDSEFHFSLEGIRVINFNAAHRSVISVDMRNNRLHGNRLGCIVENNRSDNATIFVRSNGDRFEDNGLGCMIGAALVGTSTGLTANFSTTRFDAQGSQFTNNTRTGGFNAETGGPEFSDSGGVLVLGAAVLRTGAPNTTSGNATIVRLWDVIIADNVSTDNEGKDFLAFGARSELVVPAGADPADYLAGTDNHALIQLRGLTEVGEVVAIDSEPADPNGTNTVTIVRIPDRPPQ